MCWTPRPDPDPEEAEWANAKLIAEHLQLPIRALDPTLGSRADEDVLARSRLIDGEAFDADAFQTSPTCSTPPPPARRWATTVTREAPDDPFLELRPWSYALALLTRASLAADARLRLPGSRRRSGRADAVYDYRVSAVLPAPRSGEPLHGFHLVPRGTTLPTAFALGPIALADAGAG